MPYGYVKHCCCSFSVIVFLARAAIAVSGDEGPPEEVRGLRALDHYVGSWEVVVTSRGAPFTLGQATGEWILDGGFLPRSGASSARDGSLGLEITQLMTYDPGKKTYRGWNFYFDGSIGEGELGEVLGLSFEDDGRILSIVSGPAGGR